MELEPIIKLSKDLKEASLKLSDDEARFLVDAYYQMQDNRIRSDNQIRSMSESGEPNEVLGWLSDNSSGLENQIKIALGRYVDSHIMGDWLKSVKGIGDVLSAGLLAHIDISKAQTAGAIWRYAGLDPTLKWEKGQKRPWNASLKTLCWKIGESFVKVSGKDDAVYGRLYAQKKEQLLAENEAGKFKEVAEEKASKVGKSTDAFKAYSKGKLPPAHIHSRAKRYAVKMFLSHLHQIWFERHFGVPAPKPFAIAILGHAHEIKPLFTKVA